MAVAQTQRKQAQQAAKRRVGRVAGVRRALSPSQQRARQQQKHASSGAVSPTSAAPRNPQAEGHHGTQRSAVNNAHHVAAVATASRQAALAVRARGKAQRRGLAGTQLQQPRTGF